jgi:hypothetical protein
MSNDKRRDDPPPPSEFQFERSEFIETFFKKGAEFTSSLLSELDILKRDTDRLRRENAELRHHLASEEAIRELLEKIDKLEQEKDRLRQKAAGESEKNEDFAARYAEVERELDTMANLYVALSQLHSTFEPKQMLGVIEQMLAQFVGAGSFIIYLRRYAEGEKYLEPVHAYHCSPARESIRWGDGPIGESAATQLKKVADPAEQNAEEPLACIPMVLGRETVGVIAILSFFEQKSKFEQIDFEFFKLLGTHSASAIVAAGLMADANSLGEGLLQYERLY